jgi:hypothetical protein
VAIPTARVGNGCAPQVKLQPFAPQWAGVNIKELSCYVECEIASSLAQATDAQRAQYSALRQSIEERMARDFKTQRA